jgi:hypothetical protein
MAKSAAESARERKAKGLCCSCNRPATHGVRCVGHWLREKEQAKARREAKKAANLCSICGKQPPAPGILDCQTCRDKQNQERHVENPHIPFDKPWHQRNAEAGFCMTGGKKHGSPVEGHKLCQLCLDKKRTHIQKKIVKHECISCTKPAAPNNHKCQSCIDTAKNQRKANISASMCADCGKQSPLPNVKTCAVCNEKNRKKDVARAKRIKEEIRKHYGDLRCFCCHEGNPDLLELDHINGDGGQQRRAIGGKQRIGSRRFYLWLKANNFPSGLQWACATCNRGKHRFGICPHRKLEPAVLRFLQDTNDSIAHNFVNRDS